MHRMFEKIVFILHKVATFQLNGRAIPLLWKVIKYYSCDGFFCPVQVNVSPGSSIADGLRFCIEEHDYAFN